MNSPLVSIIIPCYDSGKSILRAINSSVNQTFPNLEVIVVNDGSKNFETLCILENVSDSKVKVINLEFNSGLPAARNAGFNAAKGAFVVFLDADDWFEYDAVELMLKSAKGSRSKCFVYSDIIFEGRAHGTSNRPYREFSQLSVNKFPYSIMIKKESINWSPLYDEDMQYGLEDWNLNLKLLENNFEPIRLTKPVFHYFISPEGMLNAKTKRFYFSTWKQIQRKRTILYSNLSLRNRFKNEIKSSSIIFPLFSGLMILFSKIPNKQVLDFIFFVIDKAFYSTKHILSYFISNILPNAK